MRSRLVFGAALGLFATAVVVVALCLPVDKSRLLLDYVRVLVWPGVVVGLAVLFRSSIARLADRVRSAEVPGGKLEFFEQRLTEAVKAVEEAASEVQDTAADARYAVSTRDHEPGSRDDGLEAFAAGLRDLRRAAGNPSYRELARQAHYSASVLASAASGRSLPTLDVTRAYVAACGGDVDAWTRRWYRLHGEPHS
ncbi:helix-turn-helix domain-containing protein [Actinoallomurus iriomotensis]|uniref:HTH cro/C1-type domain-containing protein n=1 Tax=Actinoallomurus iriomotensis TaxID=478107 RepID=A0A9W6S0S0_9ACTN|nr:helix-turn-helix domain-containing protein [Actinoallomurus iriomotensis]GLY85186.1 hypothetical protein Airi02_031150 [Actinoallomurus iriomotensis]